MLWSGITFHFGIQFAPAFLRLVELDGQILKFHLQIDVDVRVFGFVEKDVDFFFAAIQLRDRAFQCFHDFPRICFNAFRGNGVCYRCDSSGRSLGPVGGPLTFPSFDFRINLVQVGVVAAAVVHYSAIANFNDACRHTLGEMPIVAGEYQRSFVLEQCLRKSLDCIDIQVVSRFVQNEDVALAQQQSCHT